MTRHCYALDTKPLGVIPKAAIAIALGLFLLPLKISASQAPDSEESRPPEASTDWFELAQRGIEKSEYRASLNGLGLQAPNRAHNLRTYFDASGIRVQARNSAGDDAGVALVGLTLSGIGRSDTLSPVVGGKLSQKGGRVEITRPGMTEWYENSPSGLEQGFNLDRRPIGAGALVLELQVHGAHASLDNRSIVLTSEAGRRLRYGKLVAWDAAGIELASRFEVASPDHLRLVVEDLEATYPIVIDPLITAIPDTTLESNIAWSGSFDSTSFGASLSGAGDVNGDGWDDIVIGAFGYDNGLFDEGAAFVFLGSASGIIGTDPASAHAVLLGDDAAGEFGNSVAGAGDVNGDGYADIIVGAHIYDSTIAGGTLAVQGAAFIFYGSAVGISGSGPSSADASLFGNQLDSRLGHTVAGAGDINNDGFADIIVGSPRKGVPFGPPIAENQASGNGGAALIFHGSGAGITGTGFSDADRVIFPYPPGAPTASQGQLGVDVAAAGDVNGDGFDDVLVGASGEFMVFHGGATGIIGTDPTSAETRILSSVSITVGTLVSGAGDVNGDGFDDIMASDSGYPNGITQGGHGAFMVFHGSASGVTATSPSQADTFIEGDLPIPPPTAGTLQSLGWRLSAAGDVDGDGFGDVIVGGLTYPGSLANEGSAYVFRGGSNGITGSTAADAFVQLTTGQASAAQRSNKPGFDVAGVGDLNGDGFADVMMGAAHFDAGQAEEGAVFVYLGGSGGGVNNAPVLAVNTGASVAEGTGVVIGSSALGVTDADPGDVLTYTVTAGPSAGNLSLGTSFTQAQIDAGSLSYTQNGSEVTSDSFLFTVSDGQGGTIGSTAFALTITPVNDAPVLSTNTGITVSEGGLGTIGSSALGVTDADPGDVLTYTVTAGPSAGNLSLGTSFTQAQIDAGSLSYTQNGSEVTSDSFLFTVSDGQGGTIGSTAFALTITPVNDAPSLGLSALPDATVGILYSAIITPTDPDPSDVLTLSLIAGPLWLQPPVDNGNGTWTLSGVPQLGDQGLQEATLRVTDSGSPPLDDQLALPLSVILGATAVPSLAFWLACVLVMLLVAVGRRYATIRAGA